MNQNFFEELKIAKDLSRQAGESILQIRLQKEPLQIQMKEDSSSITVADLMSNNLICHNLKEKFPSYGLLSEELLEGARGKKYVWMIDPLDGTENFIRGGNDFGVHIGLVEEGIPVLGVNYYPAIDVIYWAVKGHGAFRQVGGRMPQKLLINSSQDNLVLPLYSKSDGHTKLVYETLVGKAIPENEFNQLFKYFGSTGLRLCMIAEGNYNLLVTKAIRSGLWDFLSGDIIIREAGGFVSDWTGKAINYQNNEFALARGVVVCGNRALYEKILSLI